MDSVFRDVVGWLNVLPAVAGTIVCALHLKRSRWAVVLMGGFALETLVLVFYRLIAVAMAAGGLSPAKVGGLYLVASLAGFAARATIVGGLACLLSEAWAAAPAPKPALPEP